MQSTRLTIPHPHEEDCHIVGVLEQFSPTETVGRNIAIILHGTMGHKDYLFQKRLARALPCDSFRFDFRGNHESGGTFNVGRLEHDVQDLQLAANYLAEHYGYVIDLIIGHSRGSIVGFHWVCTSPQGKNVTAFVNVSARYRMKKVYEMVPNFDTSDIFELSGTVARKPVKYTATKQDYEDFANWNTAIVQDHFPHHIDVLTIHGMKDKVVPPYDAILYANALHDRTPGTHSLHYHEDADHNFTGKQDEVVALILQWWEARRSGQLKTGIWIPGIRGKL